MTVSVTFTGSVEVDTGIPVLDHLLAVAARAGRFGLTVQAGRASVEESVEEGVEEGVEAVGRAIGEALAPLLAPPARGIASASAPALEALAIVALEGSGQGMLVTNVDLTAARLGGLRSDLVATLLRSLAEGGGLTLHVRLLHGTDTGHVVDAIAKALGLALAEACRPWPAHPNQGDPDGR